MYDVLIRNGTVYDGSGNEPFMGDVAIAADEIVAVGNLKSATADLIIDAKNWL